MARSDGGIRYAEQADDLTDLADVAFAVQFTADTPLAVERAIVETWKLLHDEGEHAALEIVAVFSGSQRDDGRSWIDFHDGLSNLKPTERAEAIVIGAGSDPPPADMDDQRQLSRLHPAWHQPRDLARPQRFETRAARGS